VVVDPLVSRLHVELVSDKATGQWRIVSIGRNGTWVDGEAVSEPRLVGQAMVVQLGSNGPWLELRQGRREPRGGETLSPLSSSDLFLPQVDEELLKAEVSRIADDARFDDLRKQAQHFKKMREGTEL
jgi:pSer/pThr/pTyr-binding forkhead associated (FHA) protein